MPHMMRWFLHMVAMVPPQGREREKMETGVVSNKEAAPDWMLKRPKKEREEGREKGMR